ncbi:MAG: putative manganese-dependent inorganic diphosphatase [Vallitaleaceae bacterium]|jgi:manganese-dependent inorganic pyrophosphatase|nr:putative manganese-dependent inorganic diphosphatase [Vallitaleaceae bacterium]
MSGDDPNFLQISGTPYSNLIEQLELTIIKGTMPTGLITGKVLLHEDIIDGPNSGDSTLGYTSLGNDDILISNYQTYLSGLHNGIDPKTIILTGVKDHRALLEVKENRTIFITNRSLIYLTKKINQVAPIKNVVTKTNLEYFTTYETLDDVKKNMVTSKYNRFPVVDELGCIKGMISKGNLLEAKQKKAILVEHNEKGQSIEGIENVTLLEVIDHHRVADIQTMGPLYFRVEPVGCTSTIVAKIYEENQVEISPIMAKIMLSAILSDTLLFKSPTSTDIDEETARKLAIIAGVNLENYGMSVIYAGSDFEHATPESILTTDVKPFMFGDLKVVIAQTNTSDFNGFYKMHDDTLAKMNQLCRTQQIDLYVLLVTDVVIGGTEMIVSGQAKWIAEQAFNIRPNENSIFLPNVFSRKKQVVPVLMQAAKL